MFNNMKIRMRFVLSFSLVLVLMIAIIMVSLNQISVSSDKLSRIVEINNVRIQMANKMIDAANLTSINVRDALLAKFQNQTSENMQKKIGNLAQNRKTYEEAVTNLEALFPKEDIKGFDVLRQVHAVADTARQFQDKVIEFVEAGKPGEGTNLMLGNAYPSVIRWIEEVDALIKYNEEYNALRYNQAEKAATDARILMIILGLLAIVVSLIIAFILTTSINNPVKIATKLVTSRDLSMDVSAYMTGKNELSLMIQSFRKDIAEKLELEEKVKQRTADMANVLSEVKESVNVLASSSSQILAATTQVASGTAETATAISETTTTVEEVQQAAKLSSEKAKNVADSAQKVVQVSLNGQKAIDETIDGMNRIRQQMDSIAQTIIRLSEQSQSIGGIIASVTDIADQSNLLAVNAAIEAAKAGEHGRGFAVVAQEIKNLAGQSKQSTLEVRNILNDVQKATSAAVMATEQGSKAVEAGVKQSAQAGEAIRILSQTSNDAVQAATQIVASSQQQVIGMDQIGVAMQNINQAGTETAVSMSQSEKSARSLHELGLKLKEIVERFKE